jgi:hypothetical protein
MAHWERTHGKAIGAYLKAGANELYVRQDLRAGAAQGGWIWYVDGILMGAETGEGVAKLASEAAIRAMSRTHTGRLAAAAG